MKKNKLKILIVDDSRLLRMITRAYLAPYEVDIVEASDGEKGLEILKNNDIDLVILDYTMPLMSGQEVLDQMILDENLKNVPVIVYTTGAFEKEIENRLMTTSFAFVRKSNLGDDLIPTIKDILGKRLHIGKSKESEKQAMLASLEEESGELMPTVRVISGEQPTKGKEARKEKKEKAIKVLMCYNEYSDRLITRSYLNKHNVEITEAANGLEAFVEIEEKPPDVLIIDYNMFDGMVINVIRKLKKEQSVPVIVRLSKSSPKDKDIEVMTYASGYLEESITEENLSKVIEKVTGKKIGD